MRNFTANTGNKQIAFYLRPFVQQIQVPVIVCDINKPLQSGARLYLPDVPQVSSNMTMGLGVYLSNSPRNTPDISPEVARPVNGVNVSFFDLDKYLLLTLCDKNGVELFKRIPIRNLQMFLNKPRPYIGQICTHRSYFQVTSQAPTFGSLQIANLVFFTVPIH